jgi:hypothetical protein
LTHIDAPVCWETTLSLILLPVSTSFIAGDAFSRSYTVTLAGWESEPEFGAGNRDGQFNSSEAFERRTGGMRELATKESRSDDAGKTRSEVKEVGLRVPK